jgi:hypothetical protein
MTRIQIDYINDTLITMCGQYQYMDEYICWLEENILEYNLYVKHVDGANFFVELAFKYIEDTMAFKLRWL